MISFFLLLHDSPIKLTASQLCVWRPWTQ
jgi:hypothetical protein